MLKPRVGNAVNSAAQLAQRIACNQSRSQAFLSFVLGLLNPGADDAALDLGPGLGAQLIPVGQRVARAVGVEVSPQMVAALRARLTLPNTVVREGDMDDLAALDLGGRFTLAYAVYSLYYSRDPARVTQVVAGLLHGPRARFIVITPDVGNNESWCADLNRLFEVPADALDVPHVCRRVIVPALRDAFGTVTCTTYRDRVRVPNLDALMAYYDACAPYCRPDKRDTAREYFRAKFECDGGYEIEKCSIAVVGTP